MCRVLLRHTGVRIEGPVTTAHMLVSPSACPPDMTLRALRNAVLNLAVVVLAGEQEIFLPDIVSMPASCLDTCPMRVTIAATAWAAVMQAP